MNKLVSFFKKDLAKIALGAILLISAVIVEQFSFVASLIIYISALLVVGFSVFADAVRGILRRDLLDEKFLMSIASVGAMIVGECSEGVAVMLFFLVGETFEHIAVRRSRNSIKALMDFCPDEASLLTDEGEERVDADELEVGSRIIIRPGERVPVDCVILSGCADVDTSAMTGESIPRSVITGDTLESGVVVLSGLLTAETLKLAEDSSAQRILELVENASENKSKEETFITKFSHFYTPTVVILALILALVPPIFRLTNLSDSVYRALIFLVISCPCALVISVPMAFFGGIGGAASRGILFKGGNVFSSLARADSVALDKTGTITSGNFSVTRINSYTVEESVLCRLAASCEFASNHPIAKCIKNLSSEAVLPENATEYAGEGTVAVVDGRTVAVGNLNLMKRIGVGDIPDKSASVYVAMDGELIGDIVISDSIKDGAADAIKELSDLGVKRSMILSGDKTEKVKSVTESVGISEHFAELSPEEKYEKLKAVIDESNSGVIYVGDGINDAPSLAISDVGIAMGGVGQDSAIEASDVVLMSDELSKIPEAVKISRKTLLIAKENIVFAIGVKLSVMVLGALGIANMWLAVFADVGVAVLAILNSMRALAYSRKEK